MTVDYSIEFIKKISRPDSEYEISVNQQYKRNADHFGCGFCEITTKFAMNHVNSSLTHVVRLSLFVIKDSINSRSTPSCVSQTTIIASADRVVHTFNKLLPIT